MLWKILVVEKPNPSDKDSIIAYQKFSKVQTSILFGSQKSSL